MAANCGIRQQLLLLYMVDLPKAARLARSVTGAWPGAMYAVRATAFVSVSSAPSYSPEESATSQLSNWVAPHAGLVLS